MQVSEIGRNESGLWSFSIEPGGDWVDVHIVRDMNAPVYVSMSIGDMLPAPVEVGLYGESASSLFRVNGTLGKTVIVESGARIVSCKVMDADGVVSDVAIDEDVRLLEEDGSKIYTEDGYALCVEG